MTEPGKPGMPPSSAGGRVGRRKRLLSISAIVFVTLAVGIGAYFVGRSTGADVASARAAGEAVGRIRGTEVGGRRGYASGFRRGRSAGYQQTFAPAYRRAYQGAYDEAGLEPPERSDIDLPE